MIRMDSTFLQRRRSYENVTLVERTLAVLECVNRLPKITVGDISEECDIPASSVIRILETLCEEGYLIHLSRRGGYALTSKVRSLSAGFHGTPLVLEILKSYADDLTRRHLWPFAVGTLDRDAMAIQYSSIPLSPLAHVRTTLHKRLSLFTSGHGRAYVSFCGTKERRHLWHLAQSARLPKRQRIPSPSEWKHLVAETRRRGFSIRSNEVDPETRTIAVPIMPETGRVVATLGMTFFRRVIQEEQFSGYAAHLRKSAAEASERIRKELTANSSLPAF
jgi:IclR family mhp operon transcriptional activator